MRKQKAFTLVELLVAMAIIGVLLGLAMFGLSSAQRAQRDTERRAALQDINIGMQTFYETYNRYPTYIQITSTSQVSFCTGTCAAATQKVIVPLKGASVALNTTNTQYVAVNTFAASAVDAASTNYCLVGSDAVTNAVGNPDGYAFCAKLENTSVFCVGAGAVKGNSIAGCGLTGANVIQ